MEQTPVGAGGRPAPGLGQLDTPVPIAEVCADGCRSEPTGVGELDRVLGGGFAPGSVTVLGGEPGMGKSTLALQALASLARRGARALLVSSEESKHQVRLRAERLGAVVAGLWLMSETSLPAVLAAVDQVDPRYVVVDSVQTVHDPTLDSAPGSVQQVREAAHRLVQVAKSRAMACVLVGQVTKEGALAGPRLLEHLVDTVLSFEGDRHHSLRLLRAVKHRFGSAQEVGLFELGDAGLAEVPDAGALFLADRRAGVPGSVIVPIVEGHRPLLVELQALVVPTQRPSSQQGMGASPPRRSPQGLDPRRLALVLAVLERRAKLAKLGASDVYASAVGGVRVAEPGADLGLALAVASSLSGRALPAQLVACAEVGLAGELRQVTQLGRRLSEASRLGFTAAVVAPSAPEPPPGLHLLRAATVAEALRLTAVGAD